MKERWRTIKSFQKYKISDHGRLKNKTNGRFLNGRIDRDGYVEYQLINDDGRNKYVRGHRLVGYMFVPGRTKQKNQINHIDGIRSNNHYKNLEWVTPKENTQHSIRLNLNNNFSQTEVFDIKTGETKKYYSLKSLCREIGGEPHSIVCYIRNSVKYPIHGRYIVKLLNEEHLNKRSNTVIFGKPLFVYDYITDETTRYESSIVATYYTGITGLYRFVSEKPFVHNEKLGYSYSRDETKLVKSFSLSKETILTNRDKYYNRSFKGRSEGYLIKDYLNGIIVKVLSLNEVSKYIEDLTGIKLTKEKILSTIKHKEKVANLITLGLAVKKSKSGVQWVRLRPNNIINKIISDVNFNGLYFVKNGVEERYFYRFEKMVEYLDIPFKDNLSYEDYLKEVFTNNPNITICRYG